MNDSRLGMVSEENSGRVEAGPAAGRGPHETAPGAAVRVTAADWREAEDRAAVCREFERLVADGLSLRQAAAALRRSPSFFSGAASPYERFVRGGVAELLPQRRAAGAKSSLELPPWFIPAARFFYLLTNRTQGSGSVPEAVRRTISLPNLPPGWTQRLRQGLVRACGTEAVPVCPPELRELLIARERAGKPLLPESLSRQVTVAPAVVRQHRHATNAGLDYLSAPGSMMFMQDPLTGEKRGPRAGEVIEADDATINFPVCVPWTLGGDPCSDKYGVKVGRFQWLVSVDAARRYVTAYSYTMRPRGSYRGEDVLALIRAHCVEHGKPRLARLEQGVWKSNLVKSALRAAHIDLQTVYSPHQKPFIEGLFNVLWTKLSVHFPEAHVGRFRGENEEANDILVACQRGARDPRRHFPLLSAAISAFDEAVAEKNRTPVGSAIGRWVPAEAWEARERGESLTAETAWLFSPWQKVWTVRGMLAGGKVPLFEDLSVQFDFSAEWMPLWDGARVRCYFDPTAPRCHAMVELAEAFRGEPAGLILGQASQVNDVAGYARLVLGWGEDPANAGRLARQRAAAALRREVRAIVPGGRGYAASEERDGVAQVARIESAHRADAETRSDGLPLNQGKPGRGSAAKELDRAASAAPTLDPDRLDERERRIASELSSLDFL